MWLTGRGCGSGSWVRVRVVGCGSGSWFRVRVVSRGCGLGLEPWVMGYVSGLWAGVGVTGCGSLVRQKCRLCLPGQASGSLPWGEWQSRGALWPCSHWGGGLDPGTGLPGPPCFLPAPRQSRPLEPWAGPQGLGPAPRTLGLKTQSLGSCFMLFDAPCPQACPLTPAWSSAWSKHSSPVCSAPLGSLSRRWRHHGTQHGTCKRDFRFLAAA